MKKEKLTRPRPSRDEVGKNKNWLKTFGHAFDGCWWAFRTQKNFKVHFAFSALAILMGWWLEIGATRMLLLVLAISWGLTVEMANTAIERIVDWITRDYHPEAKIIKDVSAGMMLLLSVGLAAMGILILLPPLWQKIVG